MKTILKLFVIKLIYSPYLLKSISILVILISYYSLLDSVQADTINTISETTTSNNKDESSALIKWYNSSFIKKEPGIFWLGVFWGVILVLGGSGALPFPPIEK